MQLQFNAIVGSLFEHEDVQNSNEIAKLFTKDDLQLLTLWSIQAHQLNLLIQQACDSN